MKEMWKDIEDYEGLYQVSNLGRVCAIRKGVILKPRINKFGYCSVYLSKNSKQRNFLIHRLVAKAFIPNPNNLPQINHKDENKSNNHVDNLEWCSARYNINYGSRNAKISKQVIQLNKRGEILNIFVSANEASRVTGIALSNILNVCNAKPKNKTAGGYIFKYE